MTKRICWKKGMRLTDDVLRSSDNCYSQLVTKAFALAASGRFGLIPSSRPFSLSINISNGIVDIESLDCLAVTKSGEIIDAQYDTRYTNTFDTRVQMPCDSDEKEYILAIVANGERWKEVNDGFEEPEYSFALISPNTPITDNAMPIGHIVDEYGWRLDDVDFVPPCLYVSSHDKYKELAVSFLDVLTAIDMKARKLIHSNGKEAIRVFWPIVQRIKITVDKERDTLTPMSLLGNVQKCVSAFTCACELDEYLDLADADRFMSYVQEPYNYKDSYLRIKEGLDICFSISEKVERLQSVSESQTPNKTLAPIISNDQLFQNCRSRNVSVIVTNYSPDATVLYSIDGAPAKKLSTSGKISIENGFNKMRIPEPDKNIVINLRSVLNGVQSDVATYNVVLHKDYKVWDGFEI